MLGHHQVSNSFDRVKKKRLVIIGLLVQILAEAELFNAIFRFVKSERTKSEQTSILENFQIIDAHQQDLI